MSLRTVWTGIGFFLITFLGSLFLGVVVGVAAALLFKHTTMARGPTKNLERCLVLLVPFLAYMLAQGLQLSGVVAILFNGMLEPPMNRAAASSPSLSPWGALQASPWLTTPSRTCPRVEDVSHCKCSKSWLVSVRR